MNVDHAQVSMNVFDAIVLGVFALSCVVAFFRGFVREVLSLGAWVGAAFITMYLFPQSTQMAKHYVKSDHLAAGGAALGTYLCALMTLTLINSIIIRYVKSGSEVGIIDNLLGLIFGALRGAFVISLAFLIMSAVVPTNSPPAWLKTSVTKPFLQKGSEVLAKLAPRYLSNLEEIVKKQKQGGKDDPTKEEGETGENPDAPKDDLAPKDGEQSSNKNQLQDTLERLKGTPEPEEKSHGE